MKGLPRRLLCLVLAAALLGSVCASAAGGGAELDRIGERLCEGLLSGAVSPREGSDIASADAILALIRSDKNGEYFSDLDYSDRATVSWQPAKHLARTLRLAILCRASGSAELKEHVLSLTDYWLKKDLKNSNWWYNRLCVPSQLGDVGILMKNELSASRLKKLTAIAARGCYTTNPLTYVHATGANGIDLALSSIRYGVLSGSKAAVKAAVNAVSGDLRVSLFEGIKSDGSFFQHGNRLYMGGYGVDFINGMSGILYILSGTGYAFTQKELEPFASFILDGMRMMSFGSTLDPVTLGRSVSRAGVRPLQSLKLGVLAQTEEMPRKAELLEFARSVAEDTKSDLGMKYFDRAKLLVINNSDFYFSFRGGSDTMLYSEQLNGENRLCYNSSYPGTTTVMSAGGEYTDISPVFDYAMVPGTTAVHASDAELKQHLDLSYRILPGQYGSAVSDGAAAVFAKTVHEGISMTAACFATEDAALMLGAGMSDIRGREMLTTLDQSYYAGSFTREGNTVIHNGIKYTLLSGGELSAGAEHRSGDWSRNNDSYPSVPAEADIFTVSVKNTGSYAYSVMSAGTDADF